MQRIFMNLLYTSASVPICIIIIYTHVTKPDLYTVYTV